MAIFKGRHSVFLTFGIVSLILALGIFPLLTGAWLWVMIAAITNPGVYAVTFATSLQTVLLVLGIFFTLLGLM